MERLTFTKEFKLEQNLGDITYLAPDILRKWDDKLRAYEDTGLEPSEIKEMQQVLANVSSQPAKKGDTQPPCFYNDNGSPHCLGLTHGDDDYPITKCQNCYYSEYNAMEREEAEAALTSHD